MTPRSSTALVALCALVIAHPPALAQHGAAAPPVPSAPREAAQFDFLVGQWDLVARPMVSGLAARIHGAPRLLGTWKAWRGLDGWGIEDEMRLTDESGNPRALSHSVRVYSAAARRWSVSTLDVYRASWVAATAEWRDRAIHVSARGTDQDGRAYLARGRFYDIAPASFRYQLDRSYDDGRTWTDGVLRIEAKRVAAAAPR